MNSSKQDSPSPVSVLPRGPVTGEHRWEPWLVVGALSISGRQCINELLWRSLTAGRHSLCCTAPISKAQTNCFHFPQISQGRTKGLPLTAMLLWRTKCIVGARLLTPGAHDNGMWLWFIQLDAWTKLPHHLKAVPEKKILKILYLNSLLCKI